MPQQGLIAARTAARLLRIHLSTLRLWNAASVGPFPVARGRYRREDVIAWAAEMELGTEHHR